MMDNIVNVWGLAIRTHEVALETLKQVLNYAINKVIEPYKESKNRLFTLVNEDTYKRNERPVEYVFSSNQIY